ncbi:MAG: hypothetical protein RIR00_441, partial [Pseudomonadota bacterium]
MKPALQLKLSQHLALTPQLQQSIKLLQLSTLEMNQEIERYLLENPLLEREDEPGEAPENFTPQPGNDHEPTPEAASSNERHDAEEPVAREETPMDLNDDERWASDAGSYSGSGDDDGDDTHDIHAATTSLRDHLTWQLG